MSDPVDSGGQSGQCRPPLQGRGEKREERGGRCLEEEWSRGGLWEAGENATHGSARRP